jgi:hypothetical protein
LSYTVAWIDKEEVDGLVGHLKPIKTDMDIKEEVDE